MSTPAIQSQVSEVNVLLKDVFAPGIEEQQNLTPAMYKRFKKTTMTFGGNHYEGPARMGSPQSLGMRTYRTALPTPKQTQDVTMRVRQRYFYATGDITGPDLAKGKGNPNAFVELQTDKMEALTRISLKDMNFQFYLSGDGTYAKVLTAAGSGATTCYVDTLKYLRVGRRMDVWSNAGTKIGEAAGVNAREIGALSIDASGNAVVTFKNGVTGAALAKDGTQVGGYALADGDYLIPETALPTNSAGAGIFFHGLGAIVDDGSKVSDFQEINRATYPLWKAKVLSNGGSARPLTLQLMHIAHDVPEMVSGEKVTLILGSYNARNLYQQLLVSQKRFMDNKLDGGYQVLEFNGKPFLIDVDCQDDRIYFLNESDIEKCGLFDLKFDDTTGSILRHDSLGAGDVYYFYLKAFANFAARRCNSHSVIADLEVSTDYKIAA